MVSDIARMYGQCRFERHGIDQVYGLFERGGDVGVSLFIEADMGVADLQE